MHDPAAGLVRPRDLRAVRRRGGRGGAEGRRGQGRQCRPRRAQHQTLFRRPHARSALCGRRAVHHPDHRPSAHARQGSVPSCRHQHRGAPSGLARRGASDVSRHRLVRAAPGQPTHPRRHGEKAGDTARTVVSTVALHGNTSAASVPLAMAAAVGEGGSSAATWSSWKRWAAGLPGARLCCAGRPPKPSQKLPLSL